MGKERTLSLVIPAKDEQESIANLLTEAFSVMRDYPGFEVVLVDDGSSDQTLDTAVRTARALGGPLVTIRHTQSIGQSGALATGIRHARGDLIVTMDGDGQNDLADIPTLLQKANTIRASDFCIAGYRKKRKDTAWKRFQSRLANRIRDALLHDGVRGRPVILVLLVWVALAVVFFSIIPGKRDVYLLPALPMLALSLAPALSTHRPAQIPATGSRRSATHSCG